MKKLAFIKRSNGRHWVGDGFPVQSIFSYRDIHEEMSPFLLMDYAGPAEFEPTEQRKGVGQHPHAVSRQSPSCMTVRLPTTTPPMPGAP